MASTHHAPSSSDACHAIVLSLMSHLQRDGENDAAFSKKAIESLVKKLKEKRDELDSLITAVTTAGGQQTGCVTIPRTLDGRLQVATRKGFPHVVYARIWRWPDVHKNELKHLNCCVFGFDLKMEGICVNPYHYERVVATGIDLSNLSIHHSDDNYSGGDQSLSPDHHHHHHHPLHYGGGIKNEQMMICKTEPDIHSATSTYASGAMIDPTGLYNLAFSPGGASNTSTSTSGVTSTSGSIRQPQRQSMSVQLKGYGSDCAPPALLAQQQSPVSIAATSHLQQQLSPNALHHVQQQQLFHHHQQQPQQQPTTALGPSYTMLGGPPMSPLQPSGGLYVSNPGNSSVAYTAGQRAANNLWKNGQMKPEATGLLSLRPLPEYWCTITYFELDQKVGEIFKVPSTTPIITVDGYTDPSSPERFCLGKLTNVQRSEVIEKARIHIGRGVQLVLQGEGDVWVRCLSDHSIFVQSFYLDRQAGRAPGDAVHKIYPAAFIKVFDLNQCYDQMKQWVAMAQNAAVSQAVATAGPSGNISTVASTTSIGADDLMRVCVLRMSFVKGWGPDYPRETIKDTPCWIEIKLNRPLQLVDEVLQSQTLSMTDISGEQDDIRGF